VQLSPARFNAHLAGMGQDVAWRRAYACPCISPGSGAAKPTCPLCRGKGRQWDTELVVRIGVVNQNSKQAMAQFGVWEPGDVLFSIGSDSPAYVIGQYDRMRLINSTSPFSIVRTRGDSDYITGTLQSLTRVFWLNTAGDAVIEGSLPTIQTDNMNWAWTSGGPPAGTQYTVTGTKFDEYYFFLDGSNDRNHHAGAALPRKAPGRRFDLFAR
jgi:hypothetical protein